jgi:hypothetical protein
MSQQQHIQAIIMDVKKTEIVSSAAGSSRKEACVWVDVVCFILLFLIYFSLLFIRVGVGTCFPIAPRRDF